MRYVKRTVIEEHVVNGQVLDQVVRYRWPDKRPDWVLEAANRRRKPRYFRTRKAALEALRDRIWWAAKRRQDERAIREQCGLIP